MIGNIYKPPQNISKIIQNKRCSVFLAGSIELDKARKTVGYGLPTVHCPS